MVDAFNIVDATAHQFKPGDRVLLVLDKEVVSAKEAHTWTERLEAQFPGVRFALVAGVRFVVVEREKENNNGS